MGRSGTHVAWESLAIVSVLTALGRVSIRGGLDVPVFVIYIGQEY